MTQRPAIRHSASIRLSKFGNHILPKNGRARLNHPATLTIRHLPPPEGTTKDRLRRSDTNGTDRPASQSVSGHCLLSRDTRNPIFVFVLLGALFKFNVNTPALPPLFQLPPRMKPRTAPYNHLTISSISPYVVSVTIIVIVLC